MIYGDDTSAKNPEPVQNDRQNVNHEVDILEKAIQKAIDCGWELKHRGSTLWSVSELANYLANRPFYNEYALLIFNHDFAKALWGEDRLTIVGNTDWRTWPLMWHHHLQQMVIADDPIAYLEKNI